MQLKKSFVVFLLILVALSCKQKETQTDNLFKFKNYINYTTSGLVSVTSPITINLVNAVEDWKPNEEILTNIVSISPKTAGKLTSKTSNQLVFIPEHPLEADTEYTVTVNLKDLYETMPKGFENYTFQFKTIKPNFSVVTNDLQSYSKEWQYIEGIVKLADIVSLEDAKTLIEASQNNKYLSMKWDESIETARIFEFKIDSIHRDIDDSKVTINWNGKSINANNKGENTITIPGINNFTIVDVKVEQSPEQYLSINFSDPLKKQQNFDGLVTLQNVNNPKYIVNGNVLKVYTDTRVVGNIQVDVFQGIRNTNDFKL